MTDVQITTPYSIPVECQHHLRLFQSHNSTLHFPQSCHSRQMSSSTQIDQVNLLNVVSSLLIYVIDRIRRLRFQCFDWIPISTVIHDSVSTLPGMLRIERKLGFSILRHCKYEFSLSSTETEMKSEYFDISFDGRKCSDFDSKFITINRAVTALRRALSKRWSWHPIYSMIY